MSKVKCGSCGEATVNDLGLQEVREGVWHNDGGLMRHWCGSPRKWSLALPEESATAGGTFERGVERVLGEVLAVCRERGGQYGDGWALENLRCDNLWVTVARMGIPVAHLDPASLRELMVAALCDVKMQRLARGWKEDSAVDLINYLAFLVSLRRDAKAEAMVVNRPLTEGEMEAGRRCLTCAYCGTMAGQAWMGGVVCCKLCGQPFTAANPPPVTPGNASEGSK